MQIRPLQHWLHARIRNGHGAVANTAWPSHRNVTASSALEGSFVSTGIVVTDVSKTGWGAMCNGRAASGTWIDLRLHWNIICLELFAVLRALRRFWPLIPGKHVLVWTDNKETVTYTIQQGSADTVQSQRGCWTGPSGFYVLAQQDLVLWAYAYDISSFLADSPEEGPPFAGAGHNLELTHRPLGPPCLVCRWDDQYHYSG